MLKFVAQGEKAKHGIENKRCEKIASQKANLSPGATNRKTTMSRVDDPLARNTFTHPRPAALRPGFLLAILLVGATSILTAQRPSFDRLLTETQVVRNLPVEGQFKPVAFDTDTLFQYGMRSRLEKLHIYYRIEPYDTLLPAFNYPNIRSGRLLMHLSRNDGEYLITGKPIEPELLQTRYQADWGAVYFFQPKRKYAPFPHAKMTVVYRESAGTAYTLYSFEDPTPTLDRTVFDLRFIQEPEE